ncbi:hypothetical protein N657DRAFT_708025 [Parathielavia appendiculata]|uniref:Uncharacterized protein n=1 Tax=Parathielavia appendiculata TaxID=2587402 RepID=A0AAN6Z545_9PEZI|nr:hypothetical protein N657DRAFT_708025 [Parathielavia appendiculata]
MPGNLRNETYCTSLVHRALEAMGGLDMLVSNAGYFVHHFDISTLTTEQILHTLEVNVFASFYLVRAVAPLLPPGSSIIFASSCMASRPHAEAGSLSLFWIMTPFVRELETRTGSQVANFGNE